MSSDYLQREPTKLQAEERSLHDSLTDTHIRAQEPAFAPQTQYHQPAHDAIPSEHSEKQHEQSQQTHQPEQHGNQDAGQHDDRPTRLQGAEQPIPPEIYQQISEETFDHQPYISPAEAAEGLQQAEHGVEARPDDEDDDLGYGTDASAATTSLASNVRSYEHAYGRTYHAYRRGTYLFPNDEREKDREDMKHGMFEKLFNGNLHFAPVDTEQGVIDVLDLGTGTGMWAIQFADAYPESSVLGIDLSPNQPDWVPPNVKFLVDDAEAEWLHPERFDFIHHRHMIQAIRNWPLLYQRAFDHLKPGGWIEAQELDHFPRCDDGTLLPDDPMLHYWDIVGNGLTSFGVPFREPHMLATHMREAGFINIVERIFITPIGVWPQNRQLREAGKYWRAVLMEGADTIALKPLIEGRGWQKMEVDILAAQVRKSYLNRETHAYMPFYVVYGQKPYA